MLNCKPRVLAYGCMYVTCKYKWMAVQICWLIKKKTSCKQEKARIQLSLWFFCNSRLQEGKYCKQECYYWTVS